MTAEEEEALRIFEAVTTPPTMPPLPDCPHRKTDAFHFCGLFNEFITHQIRGPRARCFTCEDRPGGLAEPTALNCLKRKLLAPNVAACEALRVLTPPPNYPNSLCVQCQAKPETLVRDEPPGEHDLTQWPIVDSPEDRRKICETCSNFRGGKCRAWCNCKDEDRPNPDTDDGEDCPIKAWRKPKKESRHEEVHA